MGLVYWINPYHGLCSTDWYIIHQFSHRLQASAGTSRQGLWWSATTGLGEEMSRGGWVSPKLFAPNVTPTSSKLPIILGKLTWHVSWDTLISEKTIWIFLFLGGWPIVGPTHYVDIFWDDSDIKSHSSHPCKSVCNIYIYVYICIYTFVYVCMYVYIYMYIYIYLHLYSPWSPCSNLGLVWDFPHFRAPRRLCLSPN